MTQLGDLVSRHGGSRVLLVSDAGVADAGHVEKAERSLVACGHVVSRFLDVEENPTTRHVEAAKVFALDEGVDFIVGLGGGSSMDCARGVNFLLTNGGRMKDYWGRGKATKAMLPMIDVATTAGTGSECQSCALIADPDSHQKMACSDEKARCKVALLDPELTLSQPSHVTIATGLDAISHAIESFVTKDRTRASCGLARESWKHLTYGFPAVTDRPDDLELRSVMQIGASLAGAAIEQSMLGGVHACANPLTAHFDIVHGIAVSIMLPHVVRFNADGVGDAYAELCQSVGWNTGDVAAAGYLADWHTGLTSALKLPMRLADYGIREDEIPMLAREAAGQWTALHNPREIVESDFLRLYHAAM